MVERINIALTRALLAAGDLKRRIADEAGQGLMEYALLGGFIAVAAAAAFLAVTLSDSLDAMAEGIAECVDFDTHCPTEP